MSMAEPVEDGDRDREACTCFMRIVSNNQGSIVIRDFESR